MTDSHDLDRLTAWLDDEMSGRAPSRLSERVLEGIGSTSRRPGWRIPERWIPMRIAFALAVIPRAVLILALMLLLTMLVAATFVVAARPAAPHDGLVAYDSSGNILVAGPDGKGVRTLIDLENDLASPTWSNDGSRLAFYEYAPDSMHVRVHVAAADGSQDLDLTPEATIEPLEVGNGGLRWSPDDRTIALSVNEEAHHAVLLLPTDGSGPRKLPTDLEAGFPTWSPDGRWIAFQGYDLTDPTGTVGIYRSAVDGDGDGVKEVWKPDGMRVPGDFLLEPMWSPVGSAITFSDDARIVVVDAETGQSETITPLSEQDYWPTWSHDGKHLAYQRSDGHPRYSIVVVRPDGSAPSVLNVPSTGAGGFLDWAPDDTAVLAQTAAWDRLLLAGLDRSEPISIPMTGSLGNPSWQPIF
jgi:dipeptidyl aminopeptidase/acylaminoacyl peptidase